MVQNTHVVNAKMIPGETTTGIREVGNEGEWLKR
jgi:hypothetical protein